MAINLRQVPTALKQPELPRWWIWLLLLALFLISGTAYQMSVNLENKAIDAEAFWEKVDIKLQERTLRCQLKFCSKGL